MKVCEITGKVAIVGNNVSHSHHKTKRKFSPNLKTKRFCRKNFLWTSCCGSRSKAFISI